jgi:hypothetical protein
LTLPNVLSSQGAREGVWEKERRLGQIHTLGNAAFFSARPTHPAIILKYHLLPPLVKPFGNPF